MGMNPPQAVPPPALGQWVVEFPERTRQAMQQVSGQHEVTDASAPTGVTAGVAISLLQQQDEARLGPPNILGKQALETLSRRILVTIVERYREPRLIQSFGRDRAPQLVALSGAILVIEMCLSLLGTASRIPRQPNARG